MRIRFSVLLSLAVAGCSNGDISTKAYSDISDTEVIARSHNSYIPLKSFDPRSKLISIAVYDIPDFTGANEKNDDFAGFSKAVTQGADALVVEALRSVANGGWFRVLERKFSDAVLNERRFVVGQNNERRQRRHVQAERARIAEDKIGVEEEIAKLRRQIEENYSQTSSSGNSISDQASLEQTLADLERYHIQLLRNIEVEIPYSTFSAQAPIAKLKTADYLITGAIVAYDSDVFTGGTGFRLFNIGVTNRLRRDIITVNLRLVKVSSGEIVGNKTVTQTVLSSRKQGDVLNYITVNTILEFESGYVVNEPKSLALYAAIRVALSQILTEQQTNGVF
jgi:curli biogenesis system outer membrane secretion channel CsgG